MTILIILLVILIFGFLVFVHEFGHFITAKRAGVEVEEFGFGFPPRAIGKKVGDTIYSINWLPLGGFVKMKGENLTDTTPGTFGATTFWQKTKILFAGVVMNALTAYLILLYLCLTGLPPVIAGQASVGTAQYAQPKQIMAVVVEPGSPAAAAGLQRGDLISKGNGQLITDEDDLQAFTKKHAGERVTLVATKDGQTKELSVQLKPASAKVGFLGVTPFQTYQLKYNLPDAIVTAGAITLQLMWATLAAFGNLILGLFTQGQVSDNVTGPVGIVVLLKNVLDLGIQYILIFVASISVSLAVINALPLPALDGGRWAMALAQKLTKRNFSEKVETAVHAAGFVALIGLMVVVTFFDIKRLG